MKYLLGLLLLLPLVASAELLQAPTANGTYTTLDGATVKGSINVRANGCPTASSWTYALDGATKNVEYSCPLDFGGDDYLLDTKTLTDGAHTITMTAQGGGQVIAAKFTVKNGTSTPAPPSDPAWTGGTTLTWKAPSTNTDGSLLTNLAGFEIDFGTTPNLGAAIRVGDPTATSYRVEPLSAGTWYFAMKAYNAAGAESDPSPTVSFLVQQAPTTCTAPQPADETQTIQCVAPALGSWIQTRTYAAAAYPTCWAAGDWLPSSAPAGACVTPPPPPTLKVAAVTRNVRPVYEPVLAADGQSLVLGTKQGSIASGKPCTAEVLRSGTTIYASVSEVDVTLDSPTYKGREHVAVCR